jgi:glycosyltransferase involved in cell wall biosynthesis
VVEAFAKGTPVLTSDTSASAALVTSLINGAHFRTGDAADLAAKVRELTADPSRLAKMRDPARREYLQKYTGGRNHEQLIAIYERVVSSRSASASAASVSTLIRKVAAILP